MTNKKKLTIIAKLMFKNSFKNGQIDTAKVHSMLKQVITLKPYGLTRILKLYRNLIARQLSKEEIVIEAAAIPSLNKRSFSSNKSAFLKKTGARRITFQKNSAMVFGAKITHGDWVWEETLNSKLEQIKKSI